MNESIFILNQIKKNVNKQNKNEKDGYEVELIILLIKNGNKGDNKNKDNKKLEQVQHKTIRVKKLQSGSQQSLRPHLSYNGNWMFI